MNNNGLERFYQAHRFSYVHALAEIQNGFKESHWMWYIFPQIKGLGRSTNAVYYAIEDMEEACEFLNDPYLGKNLREISGELLKLGTNNAVEIFGWMDAVKLRSCMTLFCYAGGRSDENRVFYAVLDKFFNGEFDRETVRIIEG